MKTLIMIASMFVGIGTASAEPIKFTKIGTVLEVSAFPKSSSSLNILSSGGGYGGGQKTQVAGTVITSWCGTIGVSVDVNAADANTVLQALKMSDEIVGTVTEIRELSVEAVNGKLQCAVDRKQSFKFPFLGLTLTGETEFLGSVITDQASCKAFIKEFNK